MKDSTILIIAGGFLAVLVAGGYLLMKAFERAGKTVNNGVCEASSAPGNFINGLSYAVLKRKIVGDTCTDKRDASTYTPVPSCPDGQYWNGNEGKCKANETTPGTKPSAPSTPNYLNNNLQAPITNVDNPWGKDIIITRPSGETIETHPVDVPIGYKLVWVIDTDGHNTTTCGDGTPVRRTEDGRKYCVIPEYSAITNPTIQQNGVEAALGKPAVPASTSTPGAGNNVLGFKLPGVNSVSTGEVW